MTLVTTTKRLKSQEVVTTFSGEVTVQGDRARLKQNIVKLLDNAIKYSPAGGHVSPRVRSKGAYAVLDVVDTGIGIPPCAWQFP